MLNLFIQLVLAFVFIICDSEEMIQLRWVPLTWKNPGIFGMIRRFMLNCQEKAS